MTGCSLGRHIRQRIVLHVKCESVHTDRSIQRIAFGAGFDDSAYFSRLFAPEAGRSPVCFRRKYRE